MPGLPPRRRWAANTAARAERLQPGKFSMCRSVILPDRLTEAIDQGDSDGGQNKHAMYDGLPHHPGLGVGGAPGAQPTSLDEGAEQVDRRDADNRHRQLDLEHARIHVAKPLRLIRMPFQVQPRHEGFVATDDYHHQQIRDHHHVDEAEHNQHDLLFAKRGGMGDEMPKLLHEQDHINELSDNQAEIKRQLQPPGAEDQLRKRPETAIAWRRQWGLWSQGHGASLFSSIDEVAVANPY